MLGLPTVVQVKLVTSENVVESSLDRAQTWLGQTPQVFHRELLEQAYAAAIAGGYGRISDDADLVAEFAGRRALIVLGHEHNIKITTPLDLVVARQIASDIRADLVGSSSEPRP